MPSRRPIALLILSLCMCAALPGMAPAQDPGAPAPPWSQATPQFEPGEPVDDPGAAAAPGGSDQPQPYDLRISQLDVSAYPTVRAFTTVTDSSGALVRTLGEADFTIEENGTPAVVRFGNRLELDLPLAILFVIDISSSMTPSMEAEIAAVRSFIEQLEDDDRVGVIAFSDAPLLESPLTTDHASVLQRVESLVPWGQTALWDGIYMGMQELLADAQPARKALVVLSDGVDNKSLDTPHTVMDFYQEQAADENKGFSVFTLGLGMDLDRSGLSAVSRATGGTFIETPSPEDLAAIYQEVLTQIQNEYLLEYESPIESQPGAIIDVTAGLSSASFAPAKQTYRSPGLSRALAPRMLIGLIAVAVLTILLIALTIYKLARRAWLTVMLTPLEGRDYAIPASGATIGSAESCTVQLRRDPAALPLHATLSETSDGFVVEAADPGSPLLFGDKLLASKLLRSGDKFIVGTTKVTFSERVGRVGQELLSAAGVQLETPAEAAPLPPHQQLDAPKLAVPSRLVAVAGPLAGQSWPLGAGATVIGRTEGNVQLAADSQVSRRHAVIEVTAGVASVTDAGSTNGTRLNGAALPTGAAHPLFAGDVLELGSSRFSLE